MSSRAEPYVCPLSLDPHLGLESLQHESLGFLLLLHGTNVVPC